MNDPVNALRKKIDELKELTRNAEVDISDEIESLENRLQKLETQIYENMKPWDRVQMLDIQHVLRRLTIFHYFEDFIELHGDRCFRR